MPNQFAVAGIFSLVAVAALAATSEADLVLSELSKQVRTARSRPQGTPAGLTCPENTTLLVGTLRSQLIDALGEADFILEPSAQSGRRAAALTYFLASPRSFNNEGGGFPEITFELGTDHRVSSVTCKLAR